MKFKLALAFAAAITFPSLAQSQNDLVVTGARIYTADDIKPIAEAMVIRGERIRFVGSAREAMAFAGKNASVVNLGGKIVIPGMTDAHAHLVSIGEFLRDVQLIGVRSYDEVIARVLVRLKTTQPGEWITGRGWDQNIWTTKEFPTHDALSKATPNNPVVLNRVDGHAILANAKAMQLAGVTAATKDPDGGRIIRDRNGNPTGVFVDNAKELVTRAFPGRSRASVRAATLAAIADANKWGLTGVHDPGESRRTIDVFEQIAREGKLTLRNYVMVSDDSADIAYYTGRGPQNGLYGGILWIRSIKLYADGALGSRGAALLAPYSDEPGNIGLLLTPPAHLEKVAELALRKGFQVATHAIGDRGNRIALDAYDSALKKIPTADHRFRIEHAQVLSPEDIPRFARLGVIPSMQASHQTSDMGWAERRVGPLRIRGAYAWRSLLDAGSIIPNGSDSPVESDNPLVSFHSAVTRQNPGNEPAGGWYPEQRMTREEALKAMTIWPAFAGFQEKELGSLSPGKYADFVVLDRDIMRVPNEEILKTVVLETWLGGKRVYSR
jgi:predicted amidohydrolase YtcJ